jgi:parallel beta-helix repeat protein
LQFLCSYRIAYLSLNARIIVKLMIIRYIKFLRIFFLSSLTIAGVTFSSYCTSYYVSSKNGNDANSGISTGSPWKSLDRLKQVLSSLRAGDVVYFEKGSEWDNTKLRLSDLTGTAASPIIFTTYGTGSQPRLKGSKAITTFSQKGNIWIKVDKSLPDYIALSRRVIPFVYINNKRFEVSRYPNAGYLNTNTTEVNDFLDAENNSWPENYWKNGLVVVNAVKWILDSRRINANAGSRLYFDDLPYLFENGSTSYLIRNHVNACDQPGEWAQQNDSLWINYSGNLNLQKVEVPVVDTLIGISNCKYIRFDGISFERANMFTLHIEGSIVTVQNCNMSDAGAELLLATEHCTITAAGNTLSYGRRGGIYLENSHGMIKNNTLKRFAFEGADNSEKNFGVSVANRYCDGITTVTQNTFDSVNIAYHGHLSNFESFITKNVVNHYGMTISDCAAIYFGTDYTASIKHVSRNIILNSMSDFAHGIYIDYNSRNIVADSNSISGSNLAIYVHVSMNNSIRYNNIVMPSLTMVYPWNSAVRFDEYLYNLGNREVTPIQGNALLHNNIVLGSGTNESAVMYFDVHNLSSNTINYNNYFDPYSADASVISNGDDYSSYRSFTLSDWANNTGQDHNSTFNKTNWLYNENLGVTKEDFVLLVTNPTNQEINYDLRSRNAEYLDVNGIHYSQTIKIPAYYSVILFYYKKGLMTNESPLINDQVFNIRQGLSSSGFIGNVVASDADEGQALTYSITSGNTEGLFRIDAATGSLYYTNTPVDLSVGRNYTIGVQVADNGSPVLMASATIGINIVPESDITYIDPANSNDPLADGSVLHPFDTWNDVSWKEGQTYLQKAGTTSEQVSLSVNASSVILGRYGDGTNPELVFTTDNYGIRIFNLQNIRFESLNIQSANAICCLYMLGTDVNNVDITGCEFKSAFNGIRTDGDNITISYSNFTVGGSSIISYANTTKIYYNLFKENAFSIDYKSNSAKNYLYNNLFYGNKTSISLDMAYMVSFNNLFYLLSQDDKAIKSEIVPENSNHNLYFPDLPGFITIAGEAMNSLQQYSMLYKVELNSLNSNPLLVDPANNDFSVQESSPVIDAGKDIGILNDYAGNAVPLGGTTDIGLYEKKSEIQDLRVALFPNPASGIINLTFFNGTFEGGSLTVMSLTGTILKNILLPKGVNHVVDLNAGGKKLDSGTYLLSIKSIEAKPFNQKLVIF